MIYNVMHTFSKVGILSKNDMGAKTHKSTYMNFCAKILVMFLEFFLSQNVWNLCFLPKKNYKVKIVIFGTKIQIDYFF